MIRQNLDKEFKEFIGKVFPNAGESQTADMYSIWYAAIFSATNEIAKSDDLVGVHTVAYDILKEINEMALVQIKAGGFK